MGAVARGRPEIIEAPRIEAFAGQMHRNVVAMIAAGCWPAYGTKGQRGCAAPQQLIVETQQERDKAKGSLKAAGKLSK